MKHLHIYPKEPARIRLLRLAIGFAAIGEAVIIIATLGRVTTNWESYFLGRIANERRGKCAS